MIAAGAELIEHYSWVMYVFGAFLLYAGIRMFFTRREDIHAEQNFLFRFARQHLRVVPNYLGEQFFVREASRILATPLFLVLLIVEIADVTFAVTPFGGLWRHARSVHRLHLQCLCDPWTPRHVLPAGRSSRPPAIFGPGARVLLMFIGAKMIG